MKKGTQSAFQSQKNISLLPSERRLQKLTSFKTTESIVLGTQSRLRMQRREKAVQLSRSIQQQLTKAKHICDVLRSRKSDCKTSKEDNETAPSLLANFREKGKIIENNHFFHKLRQQPFISMASPPKVTSFSPQSYKSLLSLPKMSISKNQFSPAKTSYKFQVKKNQPIKGLNAPKIRKSSLLSDNEDHLQRLQEVRQIQSFVLQQQQGQMLEISIVEQHGAAVLDWEVCMGKASEFKFLKFLDEGKYGKVYLAQSHRNNMIYCIKSIYRHTLDDSSIKQLLRQVKIQTFLAHPHIVRLYNFIVDDDSAYLVLEPCLGRNLYQNLKELGKVNEKTVREWIRQVCTAVEFMHRNDIIHRDLKPQNILLHENVIKICDFGWAVHSPLMRKTSCGTPLYTPPELVSGFPYDSKIDIWSIGILTYQLLYGTIPFEIRHHNDMVKIIEQEVYFSHETLVSQAAKDFMISCLHKDPNDRATIQQLLDHEFLTRMEKYRWTIV